MGLDRMDTHVLVTWASGYLNAIILLIAIHMASDGKNKVPRSVP